MHKNGAERYENTYVVGPVFPPRKSSYQHHPLDCLRQSGRSYNHDTKPEEPSSMIGDFGLIMASIPAMAPAMTLTVGPCAYNPTFTLYSNSYVNSHSRYNL